MAMKEDEGAKGHNTRYYPRIHAEILTGYREPGASRKSATVQKTKTFGIGGIMLETDQELAVGSRYVMELIFGDTRIEVDAQVVYSRQAKSGVFQTGFRFADMDRKKQEAVTAIFLKEYEKGTR